MAAQGGYIIMTATPELLSHFHTTRDKKKASSQWELEDLQLSTLINTCQLSDRCNTAKLKRDNTAFKVVSKY